MGDHNYEHRPSFSSLNSSLIRHRLSSAEMDSPSGLSTPPLRISVSVPFKWEQEPGKVLPGTHNAQLKPARLLDPPPCRIMPTMESAARAPSSSSILDGPDNVGRPRFSSSRFSRDVPDPFHRGDALIAGRKSTGRRLLGKFRGGQTEVFDGASLGFSSSTSNSSPESEVGNVSRRMESGDGKKLRRRNSFSNPSHGRSSHVWSTICHGFKHIMHRKSSRNTHKL